MTEITSDDTCNNTDSVLNKLDGIKYHAIM